MYKPVSFLVVFIYILFTEITSSTKIIPTKFNDTDNTKPSGNSSMGLLNSSLISGIKLTTLNATTIDTSAKTNEKKITYASQNSTSKVLTTIEIPKQIQNLEHEQK